MTRTFFVLLLWNYIASKKTMQKLDKEEKEEKEYRDRVENNEGLEGDLYFFL